MNLCVNRRGKLLIFLMSFLGLPSKPSMSSTYSAKCSFSPSQHGISGSEGEKDSYSVACKIDSADDIKDIANKSQILSLILSENKLKTLPRGIFQNFSSLRYLFLDHNSLMDIPAGTFLHLDSLEVLDLSYNNLSRWSESLTQELPSLRSLNLYHNDNLEVPKKELSATNCSSFTGINIASHKCKVCNLTRVKNVTKNLLVKKMLGQFKRKCIYYPEKQEDAQAQVEIEKIRKTYVMFKASCITIPPKAKCDVHVTDLRGLEKYFKDRCYRGARALRPIVFVLGSFGFVLNLFVVAAILSLRRLRQMVPFLLVAHLSFCDFLTGVYALGTASGHEVSPDFHDIRQYRESNSKCAVFWVIFLLGQTLGVLTCLLVTIERYIATVYCMKPNLKLEPRTALIILPCFWVVALLIAFPLQLIDYKKITINFMCVLLRDYSAKKGFFVSQGLMIAFLIIYVIVVFLYCHIYVFVRNSSRQVSVKREAKLAKRIGVIVLTNFVCFALPNLSMLIFTTAGVYAPLDDIPNTIVRRWLPPMFLVLNACANPCFFAFGNNTFSTSVKQAVRPFLVKYFGLGVMLQKTRRVHPTCEGKTASTATASSQRSCTKRSRAGTITIESQT